MKWKAVFNNVSLDRADFTTFTRHGNYRGILVSSKCVMPKTIALLPGVSHRHFGDKIVLSCVAIISNNDCELPQWQMQ